MGDFKPLITKTIKRHSIEVKDKVENARIPSGPLPHKRPNEMRRGGKGEGGTDVSLNIPFSKKVQEKKKESFGRKVHSKH